MSLFQFIRSAFVVLSLSSCAVDIKHQRLEELDLRPDEGMVILGIQGNTRFERIIITGNRRTEVDYEMLKKADPFVVFTLPAGRYRFDRVWLSDFYYVPVKDNTDSEVWDFEVKSNHINYLGNIVVTKERGNGFFLRMHNRSSDALEFLESKYAEKLGQFQLRNAIAKGDDFLAHVSKLKGYPHD
jgi:hypothetical protein